MSSSAALVALLLPLVVFHSVNSATFLSFLPIAPRSHWNVFMPLITELTFRGHHVTMMSPFKPSLANTTNLTEIELPGCFKVLSSIQTNVFFSLVKQTSIVRSLSPLVLSFCQAMVNEIPVQRMLRSGERFDVVIVDGIMNDCAIPIASLFSDEVIMLSPNGQQPWVYTRLPVPPSVVPMVYMGYSSRMNFFQRFQNAWTQLTDRLFFYWYLVPNMDRIISEQVPEAPTIEDAIKKVRLNLINSDSTVHSPRPNIPEVIEVGGMHCRPAKPLSKEFSEFIEKFDGVIVFSLGSLAPAKDMPMETRRAFVTAFSRLKQAIIWKFEEKISDLPANVMTTKWLPQQDLLGHPKTKLFITHGGLLSVQEAIYHGIPFLGIPLFYDQPGNVGRIRELEIGESLDLSSLTADRIYDTIKLILNDERYSRNMKAHSAISRDQIQKPVQRAAFWAEYVLRHKSIDHLTPPGDHLNFFQYFLLDVLFMAGVSVMAIVFLIICGCRSLVRYLERPTESASARKKRLAALKNVK